MLKLFKRLISDCCPHAALELKSYSPADEDELTCVSEARESNPLTESSHVLMGTRDISQM